MKAGQIPTTLCLLPGITLAVIVALAATMATAFGSPPFTFPATLLALVIGVLLSRVGTQASFKPGIEFCIKVLLRGAVALLGLRIALTDIVSLGANVAVAVIAGMIVTIAVSLLLARCCGETIFVGVLSGVATAVCGASAALATSTVLPNYPRKDSDVAFVVVSVNVLSTIAMFAYPSAADWLGFDDRSTGILIGATIHDVAQVAASGYSVSEAAGNTSIVVKLFRVFLLAPAVLLVGLLLWKGRRSEATAMKIPVPTFAIVFVLLCCVNSLMTSFQNADYWYRPTSAALATLSTWGLLVAVGALGLSTSPLTMLRGGIRRFAIVTVTTLVLLAVVAASLQWVT